MNRLNTGCVFLLLVLLGTAATAPAADAPADGPWPAPVEGWEPVQPDEHPRLFFRKSDLPRLRRRAQTPEGRAILKRLRFLLNGGDGETMPTVFNDNPPVNIGARGYELPLGKTFTQWDAAGFGLLYQLTGEQKYADLARQCVEKTLAGQPDRDERYTWTEPGTGFRAGAMMGALGLAYDLNHDGWDDAFRKKVCDAICQYRVKSARLNRHGRPRKERKRKTYTLEGLSKAGGYPNRSNHIGSYLGGTGLALLAIRGDKHTDQALVESCLSRITERLPRLLSRGHGDRGWFAEGTHPGRTSANGGLLELLIALRSAAGQDFLFARPNAQWLTLRWILEVSEIDGQASIPHIGVYGTDILYDWRYQISHNGEFAVGFGGVKPEHRPALLWTYKTFVEPSEPGTYNAGIYPHRAVHAFLHWPIDEAPVNPDEVMPHAFIDHPYFYYCARNQWKDESDIVVNGLLGGGPLGYHKLYKAPVTVMANGGCRRIPAEGNAHIKQKLVYYRAAEDGSLTITGADHKGRYTMLAVDFSGASGAQMLLAITGDKAGNYTDQHVEIGGRTIDLLTIPEHVAESARTEGNRVVVGEQSLQLSPHGFVLEKTAPAARTLGPQQLDLLKPTVAE